MYETAARARTRIGRLLKGKAEDVALLWNATAGLHAIATGTRWRADDNVVVAASEFPSLRYVWRPFHVRILEPSATFASPAQIERTIDKNTRAIVVSHVSYLNGARTDLAELREICDRTGVRLIVDASHSLGVVPVDGSLCDAVVSSCYKWLFGPHGVAVFYANSMRWPDLEPSAIGWNSVVPDTPWHITSDFKLKTDMERFEGGNPSFMNIYYLENSLSVLEDLGIDRLEAHALSLGSRLLDGLNKLNLPVMTPEEPQKRAGSIAIATRKSERLEAQLRARGILTWGGDERLRISVHAYNFADDVDRLLEEISRLDI
ncbi:aminotransferase class V-fold PLP-dependent enzyme [Mesorhizobium sp. M0923]|uniref:aminotransferase class V-fold PLP-dependent enzyme n=1 Tax=Mesorhizobium sp. M0923 TaxID=2957028 RepID=UPI00333D02B5